MICIILTIAFVVIACMVIDHNVNRIIAWWRN